jgi:hypothetical protein
VASAPLAASSSAHSLSAGAQYSQRLWRYASLIIALTFSLVGSSPFENLANKRGCVTSGINVSQHELYMAWQPEWLDHVVPCSVLGRDDWIE